jgi:hypothetical protein
VDPAYTDTPYGDEYALKVAVMSINIFPQCTDPSKVALTLNHATNIVSPRRSLYVLVEGSEESVCATTRNGMISEMQSCPSQDMKT